MFTTAKQNDQTVFPGSWKRISVFPDRKDHMVLKKVICAAGLVCSIGVQLGFGQDRQHAPALSASDPFSLAPGSSFSASGTLPAGEARSRRWAALSSDLSEAMSLIAKNHVTGERLSSDVLTGSAITSMLHALDPHSNYYDPAEFQELLGEHESEYTGTGSSIAGFERDGRIETYVVSTFPDSPAAKAKLRFGDRILAVDGQGVSGRSPDVVRDLVRGKRGTVVRLTIERPNGGAVETVEMKRDRVHEPAVPKGFLLKGSTGYIDLTNGFSNATFAEFETAFAELKRQGMTSLVLDLRGNGGGILDQAVKVAEKFLPAGSTIVSQRGRYADDTRTWRSGKARHESLPLVLLVDESTASASEVLAGALQDNDRALILGRKTFGKGLVQNVLNLPEGAGLTLTAARYYTPTGRSIQRDYADTGLYDYYNHRTAEIDKPVYAAKTITKRVVYGGDGITPDETVTGGYLNRDRIALLDPIFFFSVGVYGRRAMEPAALAPATHRDPAAPEAFPVDEELLRQFEGFVKQEWAGLYSLAGKEKSFVKRMLAYYLSMGTRGPESAARARVESDIQVQQAISALPQSAQLAAAAAHARRSPEKEKSSLSLVLSEQR